MAHFLLIDRDLGNCEEQLPVTDCRSTVGRQVTDRPPSDYRQSDRWPKVGRQMTNCLPTDDRQSVTGSCSSQLPRSIPKGYIS